MTEIDIIQKYLTSSGSPTAAYGHSFECKNLFFRHLLVFFFFFSFSFFSLFLSSPNVTIALPLLIFLISVSFSSSLLLSSFDILTLQHQWTRS
jgi:hypothetical protein